MKLLLAVLALCGTCVFAQVIVDNGGAAVTVPSSVGSLANIPSTCQAGQQYYAFDQTNPQYICSSNTWFPVVVPLASGPLGYVSTSNGPSLSPTFQPPASAGSISYYLTDTASSIATYLSQTASPYSPITTLPFTGLATGTDLLDNWATVSGIPNLSFIPAGTYLFHIHASHTGGGTVTVYAQFWEVSASGADIAEIGQTESSTAIPAAQTEYTLAFVDGNVYTLASTSSRIVTRVFAMVSGSSPTLDLYVGGTADSHTAFPTNTVDASFFIPYTGATNNLNMGTHSVIPGNLQGTGANLLSASTVSGTAAPLCTDASGAATTVGCPAASTGNLTGSGTRWLTDGSNYYFVDSAVTTSPVVPAAATWTWDNQGSSTIANITTGGLAEKIASHSADFYSLLWRAQPATPYSAFFHFRWGPGSNIGGTTSSIIFGAWFRASNGKYSGMAVDLPQSAGAPTLQIQQLTNSTTASTASAQLRFNYMADFWARLRNDGTNLNYDYSIDGSTWVNLGQMTVGSFLTPNAIAFGGQNGDTSSGPISVLFLDLIGYYTTNSAAF